MKQFDKLSPRERQILEAVYRLGEATAAEVRNEIRKPPGYDAVRTTMRLLEEKGFLKHRSDGPRYVYRAAIDKSTARRNALENVVRVFFDGSARSAAVALLNLESDGPDDLEIDKLRRLIAESENQERGE
ncbi:MAG TPA: BlaI/MecI/CopY family transcriptional regulator [Longimicrobiales bacterium]|nr:BlaI/MecI/CopY family transcriptional regulator [Longimicrobiales bacterium]